MEILPKLGREFGIKNEYVESIVKLIDEGNTIPFIARYRKELTGALDDQILRELYERLVYLRGLNEKRNQVRNLIDEQGNLTEEIDNALNKAETLTEIDDIYRPFKPKRRTRATIAKEKGLESLANVIWAQKMVGNVEIIANDFVDPEKGVEDVEDAISGAKDIIAEMISDDAEYRSLIRKIVLEKGILEAKATDSEKESVYDKYYDYTESILKMPAHRVLAINRGEKESFLSVKIIAPDEIIINKINTLLNKQNKFTDSIISETIEDSYNRLIYPSIEREVRNQLTERSEESAIRVFATNLRQLLLQPPVKDMIVLALDPGYRTGCKVAIVDETGKVLHTDIVYCTPPQSKILESKEKLIPVIKKHGVNIIAIGNGTASRETEMFVSDMIPELDKKIPFIIVNEAGASVYSASKLGAEEFPDFDVALRSAVSIGRRLQDPLAELVKIDPKSIGVGQYQHDMNQKRLGESLNGVVESCVNSVGIELNTASASLLSYVAGVNATVSKNIISYREENGKFKNRKELLKVKSLGPKTYEQSAGFLRIMDSNNPLDNTGVHPETYKVAEKIISIAGFKKNDIRDNKVKNVLDNIEDLEKISKELNVGIPTIKDIIKEIEKPGRDPRDEMEAPLLREDILSMEDLKDGMILQGTVRNAIDFGIFVDIGVHHDGLVHVSEISDGYVKHPLDAVSVGDIVTVKVLSLNLDKKRIALTMRGIEK